MLTHCPTCQTADAMCCCQLRALIAVRDAMYEREVAVVRGAQGAG